MTEDKRRHNRGTVGRQWAVNTVRVTTYIPEVWLKALDRFGSKRSDATRNAIDTALHSNGITFTGERKVVRLTMPLKCSNVGCNNDTYAANASAVTLHAATPIEKQWLLQPICESCVQKMAENYQTQLTKE